MTLLDRLFRVLIALIVFSVLSPVTASNTPEGEVLTTLAIDVGSSATRLSVLVGENGLAFGDTGEPRIILTGPGTHSLPGPLESHWTADGFLIVQDGTDEAHYVHPFNTLFNLDHAIELRSRDERHYHNRPNIPGYQAFTLIDITRKYVEKLKKSAKSIVRDNIKVTVIVVPNGQNLRIAAKNNINDRDQGNFTSYFRVYTDGHNPQRTTDVLESAIPEDPPGKWTKLYKRTSASIFPIDNGMEYRRIFLVYRLGSSTFEVSVNSVKGGVVATISSVYNQHLGGNDFNQRVADHLLQTHKNKTGQDLSGDDLFLHRLGSEVEQAKQVLSVRDSVLIEVESPQSGDQGLSYVLTRSQFEHLNMDLFAQTLTAVDQAINHTTYTKENIHDIVFSGGSTNIPWIQSILREYFGPQKIYHLSEHPETTAVLGAAKLGHWYQDERHYTGGICCFGVSIATIGIETAGGVMFKYIDHNAYRTINQMYTFTTTQDDQDQVAIRIYRGKWKRTIQNTFLGEARLSGIAPAPKGIPQIRVWLVSRGCGEYINVNVMDVASGRINATIVDFYGDGKASDDGTGALEIEPAGKLIIIPDILKAQ